jgi:hypothetical protein
MDSSSDRAATDDTANAPAGSAQPPLNTLGRVLLTEESIYGLILISGMILVSGLQNDASWRVLITVIVTVLVFWLAHVYAGTLSRFSGKLGGGNLARAIRDSLHRSRGLLVSAILPIAVLALGTLDIIDDHNALWWALWANTLVLGALGWIGVARWSKSFWWRLASALTTALFGGFVIILKAIAQH